MARGKVGKKNFLSFVQYTREVVAGPDGGGGVTIQKFNFDATVAKAAADAQITTLTADQEDGMKQAVTDFEASAEFTKHEDVIVSIPPFSAPQCFCSRRVRIARHEGGGRVLDPRPGCL
ncbi:hypothetical protein KJ359_003555 [Pestalotiopsis sp. 9143b]|nr:hypothetical protein KJ359_003555 [Pestalotiopsis sp. 9143b]